MTKQSVELIAVRPEEESVDGYLDYHRPYELTYLHETFTSEISHSVRDFMPNSTNNVSPFEVRIRPGRRWEETGNKISMKNPSLTGQSSTSSTTSSGSSASSDSDESCSVDEEYTAESQCTPSNERSYSETTSFEKLFPSMKEVYGVEPEDPKKNNIFLYKRYVFLHINSVRNINTTIPASQRLFQNNSISSNDCYVTEVPKIPQKSVEKYKKYIESGFIGASEPSPTDLKIYQTYAACL